MSKFIVFEGLDGTGKSTQIRLLADRLRARGETVYTDAEPTGRPAGRLLRKMLAGEFPANEWANAALFFADRVHHNTDPETGIKARLARGETVLSDRYYYSTFAYQGVNTDLDWVIDLHYGCPEIARPDLVLFLTMPPEKCLARIIENRGNRPLEIYETPERLAEIAARFRTVFETLGDRENVAYIDADGSVEEVAARVCAAVEAFEENR